MPLLSDHSTLTDQGGREANEDSFLVAAHDTVKCWVVCDGLGGHFGGDVASKTAVAAIERAFAEQPEVAESTISRCLLRAEEAILAVQKSDHALVLMRTTAVVLVADRERAVWGHLGDSRLYHFRDGRIASQSRDHSVPGVLAVTGQIEFSEIRHHADRGRLLRSLGEGVELKAVVAPVVALSPTDAFLLCTDGFWEFVLEEEMEGDLAGHRTASEWLSAMRQRLMARVATAGNNDNFTAVAVCFQGEATLGATPPAAPEIARADAPPKAMARRAQSAPAGRLIATIAVATLSVLLGVGAYWTRGPIMARFKSRFSGPAPAAAMNRTPPVATLTPAPASGPAPRAPAGATPGSAPQLVPPLPPVAAVAPPPAPRTPGPPLLPASSELVTETYSKTFVAGMEAYLDEQWDKAVQLLSAARGSHPEESATEKFQVRKDPDKKPYVPSFFISLAQMRAGHCPAAKRTWREAPVKTPVLSGIWDKAIVHHCR